MDRNESDAKLKLLLRDYWSGDHRPYQGMAHTVEGVLLRQLPWEIFGKLLEQAGVKDGDVFELTIRKTGERPFGDRRIVYTKPHTYELEPEATPSSSPWKEQEPK